MSPVHSNRLTRRAVSAGALLLILALALGLRCYRLGAQSLWSDEGTSVALAERDLATIARDAALDIHPPLYYWLLSGWVRLAGHSEAAVRALSALLGTTLVALIFALGVQILEPRAALVAALLAAIHPFQIYYAQEARMYMLLAAVTAAAMLALVAVVQRRAGWPAWAALIALEAAGLYTHYSFVFVVLVLNLAYLPLLRSGRRLWPWLGSQAIALLLYLPWLPIALRQATAWPSPAQPTSWGPALIQTWQWLNLGPTAGLRQAGLPLAAALLLAVAGAWTLAGRRRPQHSPLPSRWPALLLILWVGLPVALMFLLGLYRPAYLKFLLVTTPALSLLLATGLVSRPLTAPRTVRFAWRAAQIAALLALLAGSALALRNYYVDPAYARDDYRGLAAYIEAMGRPGDQILLNAPGQQEVFRYYYHGALPVHPLPTSRPPDQATTEAALAELSHPGTRWFAVLWATGESDPERLVEGWLDGNAFKSLDSWYGNVRLAVYAVPQKTPDKPDRILNHTLRSADTGDEITLLGYSLLNGRLAAGEIAQVSLFWQAERTPSQRYKVFLHLLDPADQIVGQRDAEPGGGVRLTTLWEPKDIIADHYGVAVHPATPPGSYRVEVGLYNPSTGQRLSTPDGESQAWLEPLTVERPSAPAPIAALGMEHTAEAAFGELALLGYDAHKLGLAHQPDAPLRAGDLLHVSLYWQADVRPTRDWQAAIALVGPAADGRVWAEIVANPVEGYSTSRWQVSDIWRGQFNLALPGDLPAGQYRLQVQLLGPGAGGLDPFLSEPLRVVP